MGAYYNVTAARESLHRYFKLPQRQKTAFIAGQGG